MDSKRSVLSGTRSLSLFGLPKKTKILECDLRVAVSIPIAFSCRLATQFLGLLRAPDRSPEFYSVTFVFGWQEDGVDIRDSVRDCLRRSYNGWLGSYDDSPHLQACRQGSIQFF